MANLNFNNSYNYYNPYNNPQQQRQNQSLDQIRNIFRNLYNLQNQPELGQLILILQNIQTIYNKQLKQILASCKHDDPNDYNQLKNRCQKIKEKNQKILLGVMNVKQKLIRIINMNAYIIKNLQAQNKEIQQKNIRLRNQIQKKVMYLRQSQLRKRTIQNMEIKKQYKPVFTVLEQLKEGTICLKTQIVKYKADWQATFKKPSH